MAFYEQGRKERRLRDGIRLALQAMLASPQFLFRLEQAPAGAARRAELSHQRPRSGVAPVVLPVGHRARRGAASSVATQGTLQTPAVLDKQVRRMLADPRVRGAGHALRVAVAAAAGPRQDPSRSSLRTPHYDDHAVAEAMRRETELFFDSLVREDRSVLELLTADYTFVNERLAQALRHSRTSPATQFRRVPLPDRIAAACSATAAS